VNVLLSSLAPIAGWGLEICRQLAERGLRVVLAAERSLVTLRTFALKRWMGAMRCFPREVARGTSNQQVQTIDLPLARQLQFDVRYDGVLMQHTLGAAIDGTPAR
jgi:hypothetical protein